MGLFSETECQHCGSKNHSSDDCPHDKGLFGIGAETECGHCGSKEHATADCPHDKGIMGFGADTECRHCGSRDHASDDCPHDKGIMGFGADTECRHCGSRNHASDDCPHDKGIMGFGADTECRHCGSCDHSTSCCPHLGYSGGKAARSGLNSAGTSQGGESRSEGHSGSTSDGCSSGSSGGCGCGGILLVVVILGIAVALFGVAKSCSGSPFSTRSGSVDGHSISEDALPGERYPETRMRMLRSEEVKTLTNAQLRYAINEMFARRGASFPQAEISGQFRKFGWYRPRPGLTFDQVEAEFSGVEKANLELLAAVRESRKQR